MCKRRKLRRVDEKSFRRAQSVSDPEGLLKASVAKTKTSILRELGRPHYSRKRIDADHHAFVRAALFLGTQEQGRQEEKIGDQRYDERQPGQISQMLVDQEAREGEDEKAERQRQ